MAAIEMNEVNQKIVINISRMTLTPMMMFNGETKDKMVNTIR